MTQIKKLYYQFTILFVALLNSILVICANTTSCFMVYQPKTPSTLNRFRKI